MKIEDIPCPPPPGFHSGEYSKASNDATYACDPYRVPWGKGGHLSEDNGQFFESVWGVPDPRRGGGKY